MKATALRLVTVAEASAQSCATTVAAQSMPQLKTQCSNCNLREVCLPCGFSGQDKRPLDGLVYARKRIKQGESLYRAGEAFHALYAVRAGFFKASVMLEDGREQVTGFHMGGEIVGMDGIGTDIHQANIVALEDSEVCVIPYARLHEMGRDIPGLQHHINRIMSREIVRDQSVMLLLGSMNAEERLATFLLNLSQRFLARGYSQYEFRLRMTREDIGGFLGMRLETISRAFSKFQGDGLIAVDHKQIRIVDLDGLKRVGGYTVH